ncbi:hypothetical protein LUZ62_044258 [Rhynchospora pubera]|uniref:DUF4378 domain-containing protein n=1 Tax=Rhynchospora pubera TaxID=906938 RepID=A0AAV8FI61_9POAL|nr:hypothetical protein LUZ62_044258 [Rhynchospora pubera]
MRAMHRGSSGRSRSEERGSAHLKKQTVVSSDISQNYYSISPELSRSSSKKSIGVPMKCLIEEELTMKEKKTRHPSPGVIARLMGLDTLPPSPLPRPYPDHSTPHYHKKKREVSPDTLDQVPVPPVSHERYVFTEDELPEFKDVFEITEARKAKKKLHSSPVHSKNGSPEMDFVRKKFAEAKRLSTEESLRSSREFNDTIEALESKRDALLEFFSEPNSLFARQLKDLTFLPPSPPRSASQITILKPSCKQIPGANLERVQDYGKDSNFHNRKHVNDLSCHSREDDFVSLTFDKPIKSNYRMKGGKCIRPTNIVVLKPSLDKTRRTVEAGAFPVFYPEVSVRSRFTNGEDSFVGTRAKSSREIARQVTRQMRRAVSAKSDYLPDENPLYEFNPLYDDGSYYTSPKVYPVESSVSKEARKRLSDRWKTAHMTNEVGPLTGGGSSTLQEMLALSDIISNDKPRKDKCILGISSNDGWKDGNVRNLPRSKSLPSSSHARVSHRSSHRRRGSRASEFGMLNDVLNAGPMKGPRGDKKHTSDVSEGEESVLTEREIHVNSEELKPKGTDEVKIEVNTTKDASLAESIPCDGTFIDEMKQLETDAMLEAVLKIEDVMVPALDDVAEKQELIEHTVCSKEEEEQPSPNSTLESPFEEVPDQEEEEETSTSGCFEKISADLQELRMQLNLLKMDSTGEQGDVFLLSDEEDDNPEQTDCREYANRDYHFRDEEERDFSYLLDMLTGLGGHASTQDELLSLCYSLDFPVGPSIFIRLEKKYGHLVLWPKSERKMLFDLINSILSEIIGTWIEKGKMFISLRPRWERDWFVDELWGRVVKRRKEIECSGEERFLEARWSGIEEKGVDLVAKEIESILHEDLLCELVTELVCCC